MTENSLRKNECKVKDVDKKAKQKTKLTNDKKV
jgi:hypothetical protein